MLTANDLIMMYQEQHTEEEILNACKEINIENLSENNLIHIACSYADEKACAILIERGVDINARNSNGDTPILILATSRNVYDEDKITACTKILLEKGAKIPRSGRETTALIEAALNCHIGMVQEIINSGCRINSTNSSGQNILHALVYCYNILNKKAKNIIKLLDIDDSSKKKTELLSIQENEKKVLNLIKDIIDKNAIDIDEKDNFDSTPYDDAIDSNLIEVANAIRGNADDETGGIDIFKAIYDNNEDLISSIIKGTADLQSTCDDAKMPEFKGKTPLASAILFGRFAIAELLLKNGANPNYITNDLDNNTAFAIMMSENIHSSDKVNLNKLLDLFIENGWDVELPNDKSGNSALAMACKNVSSSLCRNAINYLIQHKSNVNSINNLGQSVLMNLYGAQYYQDGQINGTPYSKVQYCGYEELDICEKLLDAGADTNVIDNWGNTLLHYIAAACENTEARKVAELLLDYDIPDVNAVNNFGLTAMDIAVEKGNESFVKFLLENS